MPENSIQQTEKNINTILFRLCLLITLIAMGMMLTGFFTRGSFPPTKISTFYIGVLLVYSIHKEALRWLEEKSVEQQKRNGEYLVYAWVIITALLYLVNFLTKNYFSFSPEGKDLPGLSEITLTTLEVCGVFIVTRLSKIITLRLSNRK